MKSKFSIAIAISLAIMFVSTNSSSAIWNGTDPEAKNRAIAIYNGPPTERDQTGLSGFLYSPYLVFTVAHGFYGDDRVEAPKYRDIPYSVGLPGATAGSNAARVSVSKVLVAKNFVVRNMFQENGTRINRQNDFAVLVLSTPLPVDGKKVTLLTPSQHEKMIAEKTKITLTGYGHQTGDNETNPQSPDEKLDRKPKSIEIEMYGKSVPISTLSGVFPFSRFPGRNFTYDQTLNFYFPYGSNTSICSGDSGAPYYLNSGNEILYLGANSSAIGISNCGTLQMAPVGGFVSGDPVYLFKDLIIQAEDYAASIFGAKARTIPIKCVKGKKFTIPKSSKSKCPIGYTLRIG